MSAFKDRPDDLMETAIHLVLMNCKNWPTVADIKSAIDELLCEQRYVENSKQLTQRSRWMTPAAKQAFEIVSSGKAKEFLDQMDISDVSGYARKLFPDISDDTIRRNYTELHACMQSMDRCRSCQWQQAECDTKGFSIVPVMQQNGWIKTEYAMCSKHKKWQAGRTA